MALIEIDFRPNRKKLRDFGNIALIALTIVPLLLYLLKDLPLKWALLIFTAGCAIFILSRISTPMTKIIYLTLTMITIPIGMVVGFTMMAAFYFLLLTPLALFFRLTGRDPLHLKADPEAKTYWLSHRSRSDAESYFRQS